MIFALWLGLSVVAGAFAQVRRNRNGIGWFFVAVLLSPLVAFLLLLVLRPFDPTLARFATHGALSDYDESANVPLKLALAVGFTLILIGLSYLVT